MLFSLPAGTKMFQFPALASILDGWYSFRIPGCPIRRFTDQGLFAPPRDFSQLITSFIASESQGIRHAPLLTFLITPHCQLGSGMIYTFSSFSLPKFTCLLHHVIDLVFQKFSWRIFADWLACARPSYSWRITDSNR